MNDRRDGKTVLVLKQGRHEVRDIPMVKRLRRVLRDPSLFAYQHQGNGNWVVGSWLSKLSGTCVEYAVFGGPHAPDAMDAYRQVLNNKSYDSYQVLLNMREACRRSHFEDMEEAQADADLMMGLRAFFKKRARGVQGDNPLWEVSA